MIVRGNVLHALLVQEKRTGGLNTSTGQVLAEVGEGVSSMKDEAFAKLLESVKQAGEIHQGILKPSRVFEFSPLDVKAIREQLQQSQSEFALMIVISTATLQNWEQGRRKPEGPAHALLQVAMRNPAAVKDALMPRESVMG
jgi:putative transcriptional regulator